LGRRADDSELSQLGGTAPLPPTTRRNARTSMITILMRVWFVRFALTGLMS
jgi:hypothetical protein